MDEVDLLAGQQFDGEACHEDQQDDQDAVFDRPFGLPVLGDALQHTDAESGVVRFAAVDLGDDPFGRESLVRDFPFRRQEISREGRIRTVGMHPDLRQVAVRPHQDRFGSFGLEVQLEGEDRRPIHPGFVQLDGFPDVGRFVALAGGAFTEGIVLAIQVEVHVAFDASQVADVQPYTGLCQSQFSTVGRKDERAGRRHVGIVHHHVVDGAVEFPGCGSDFILEGFGIQGAFEMLDDALAVGILFRLVVRQDQSGTGQGLGIAPALGDFHAAVVRIVLALADLVFDHGQGNQHQQGDQGHKGDFEKQG